MENSSSINSAEEFTKWFAASLLNRTALNDWTAELKSHSTACCNRNASRQVQRWKANEETRLEHTLKKSRCSGAKEREEAGERNLILLLFLEPH